MRRFIGEIRPGTVVIVIGGEVRTCRKSRWSHHIRVTRAERDKGKYVRWKV